MGCDCGVEPIIEERFDPESDFSIVVQFCPTCRREKFMQPVVRRAEVEAFRASVSRLARLNP